MYVLLYKFLLEKVIYRSLELVFTVFDILTSYKGRENKKKNKKIYPMLIKYWYVLKAVHIQSTFFWNFYNCE